MTKYIIWFGFILLLLSGVIYLQWPKAAVSIVVCDVGQGDGVVIQQGFSQLLVDVGPPGKSMAACLGKVTPFWDRDLEAVILTHTDSDHSGGLEEISRYYHIHQLITTEAAAQEIKPHLAAQTQLLTSSQGDQLQFGAVTGQVLWPPLHQGPGTKDQGQNNTSLVWRLRYGSESIWFAGDTDESVEAQLLKTGLVQPTKYLKMSHHGSKTSTSEPFLSILQPRQVWISVGAGNRYGHPHSQSLLRLNRIGSSVWRTDQQGPLRLELQP